MAARKKVCKRNKHGSFSGNDFENRRMSYLKNGPNNNFIRAANSL